jgi:HD-like signal output (HDOD) protein
MQEINTEVALPQFLNKFDGKIHLSPPAMNIHVLMKTLADDNMGQRELAAVLHHYPVITARLIALSNSVWACPATPITNIETACVRLGTAVIKGVSIAIAVAASFNAARCPAFDPIRFWTTSMLVSEGAGLLATKLPNKVIYTQDFQHTAQTAGILHNLGLLWLADNLATDTSEALHLAATDSLLSVNQALMQQMGIDYCLIGAWIGKQWQIPEELIAVMRHHRDKSYQNNVSPLVLLVGAAAKMVSSMLQENHQMPDNQHLHNLGIDEQLQSIVFNQLTNKIDSTRELAKTLFL